MNWFFYLFLFLLNGLFAQKVVNWNVVYDKNASELKLTASIQDGWHLYSQHIENNVGPVPTSFSFNTSNDFQLVGAVNEPTSIKKYDPNFEATLDFFEKDVVFTQKVKVFKNSVLDGTITFMVCNESMCLPPSDFKFKIEINK